MPVGAIAPMVTPPAWGDSCVAQSSCGEQPIQFTPGQWITVEVINATGQLVEVQSIQSTDPLMLSPGQSLILPQSANTRSNFSLMFWDRVGIGLTAMLSQPEAQVLRIEIKPQYQPPGSSTVYLRDDGRVDLY